MYDFSKWLWTILNGVVLGTASLIAGCQLFVDEADQEVYRLIETRQRAALGETREARIDKEAAPVRVRPDAYEFAPHPTDSEVPPAFDQAATQPAIAATRPATQPAATRVVTLSEVLAYGFAHSREFQSAKEDLYLAALSLSLERHLWTPQLMGEIRTRYANYGQIRDFDHAAEAVAEVGVQQLLPHGGEVTAKVISTLMRDLTNHVTTAETGRVILAANIPLLRGAGRSAYESRYQAERDLIYAVRAFERFRRVFAVQLAGEYFNLQRLRQEVINAGESIKIFEEEVDRAKTFREKERLIPLEVQRAQQNLLVAINTRVDAEEAYRTALDQFKVRIGMPTEEAIDAALPEGLAVETLEEKAVAETRRLEDALAMPAVKEAEAIWTALKYRLDLLNDLDRIGDAQRGVHVAENNLLPDLTATGTVQLDTDPDRLDILDYNTERTTWRAGLNLELPLDRKAERNALRESLILRRRAERRHEEVRDVVRFQVRRAMRRVVQENMSLEIQERNRDLALVRRSHARFLFDRGKVSNREVVEAEDILLGARNRLARAQAAVRLAILEFRRDTGTLRIDDRGRWAGDLVLPPDNR